MQKANRTAAKVRWAREKLNGTVEIRQARRAMAGVRRTRFPVVGTSEDWQHLTPKQRRWLNLLGANGLVAQALTREASLRDVQQANGWLAVLKAAPAPEGFLREFSWEIGLYYFFGCELLECQHGAHWYVRGPWGRPSKACILHGGPARTARYRSSAVQGG